MCVCARVFSWYENFVDVVFVSVETLCMSFFRYVKSSSVYLCFGGFYGKNIR